MQRIGSKQQLLQRGFVANQQPFTERTGSIQRHAKRDDRGINRVARSRATMILTVDEDPGRRS